MFGIIYTPTEADAIQNYSRLFRKPEGCFLSIEEPDKVDESLASFSEGAEVDYIVVSDGEQVRKRSCFRPTLTWVNTRSKILGIGDQGVGAILISVAKLAVTTVCAGIHPSRQLPVALDCGTNVSTTLPSAIPIQGRAVEA